jgi:hypothetical protein
MVQVQGSKTSCATGRKRENNPRGRRGQKRAAEKKNINWRPEGNQKHGLARGKQNWRAAKVKNSEKTKKGNDSGKIHQFSVRGTKMTRPEEATTKTTAAVRNKIQILSARRKKQTSEGRTKLQLRPNCD